MAQGLTGYGAYVPYHRLARADITAALGPGGGKGTRSVASYDEDTTSMAVEAARIALARARRATPSAVVRHGDAPLPGQDQRHRVHAALRLDAPPGGRHGRRGALRRRRAVLAADATTPTLVVLSDIRTGLPGGADERTAGTAPPPSSSAATVPVVRRTAGRTRRRPTSSWTAGGCPGEPAVPGLGGALRRGRLRAAGRRRLRRRAQAGRATPGGRRPLMVAGLHGRAAQGVRRRRGVRRGGRRPRRGRSATPAPPSPGCCSPTCWTGPSRARPSSSSCLPTVRPRRCCARPKRCPRTAPPPVAAQIAAGAGRCRTPPS